MSVPIWIEQQSGGTYTACVLGASDVRVTAPTKDAAVAGLRAELETRLSSGELLFLDVQPKGLVGLAGKHKDNPAWQEMWDEIKSEAYRYRDELKAQEFPE